jgi:hypothetical protein
MKGLKLSRLISPILALAQHYVFKQPFRPDMDTESDGELTTTD